VPPTEVPVQETSIGDMIERDRIQRQQVSATFPAPGVRSTSARLARGFDLRQAVIMREIFEKPIGMRPPQDESF